MTNDELRALADALDDCDPPYYESSPQINRSLDACIAKAADYLRAQADAQPVAWRDPETGDLSRVGRVGWEPLYTHPAPAAPQAEPIDPHMIVAEDRFPDEQAEPKREPTCLWSRADDDTDVWETSCGHAFTIIEGTPSDNHMEFCCYCGRRVDEEIGGSDE